MAGKKQKEQQKEPKIKLRQPDRSGPDPTQQSLFEIAEARGLLKDQKTLNEQKAAEDEEPLVGRSGESFLWSISLTMLHFTLDVFVAHQYAQDMGWPSLWRRATQAFPVIFLLFYTFHPHPTPSILVPRSLAKSAPPILHQLFFCATSTAAGCYLIHTTNTYGYYAVMKQSPPLGCIWIWSVIELDVAWASASLLACIGFLKYGGYAYL